MELSNALHFIIVENWVSSSDSAASGCLCLLSSFALWYIAAVFNRWMLHKLCLSILLCLAADDDYFKIHVLVFDAAVLLT